VNQFGLSDHEYSEGERAAALTGAEKDLRLPGRGGPARPADAAISSPPRATQSATTNLHCIRTFWECGVWHVTKDNLLYGHYLEARPALHAAIDLVLDIELDGGSAKILFGFPPLFAPPNQSANL
jgi:hypothetical protein